MHRIFGKWKIDRRHVYRLLSGKLLDNAHGLCYNVQEVDLIQRSYPGGKDFDIYGFDHQHQFRDRVAVLRAFSLSVLIYTCFYLFSAAAIQSQYAASVCCADLCPE